MGHLVNPVGFRLGYNNNWYWKDRWCIKYFYFIDVFYNIYRMRSYMDYICVSFCQTDFCIYSHTIICKKLSFIEIFSFFYHSNVEEFIDGLIKWRFNFNRYNRFRSFFCRYKMNFLINRGFVDVNIKSVWLKGFMMFFYLLFWLYNYIGIDFYKVKFNFKNNKVGMNVIKWDYIFELLSNIYKIKKSLKKNQKYIIKNKRLFLIILKINNIIFKFIIFLCCKYKYYMGFNLYKNLIKCFLYLKNLNIKIKKYKSIILNIYLLRKKKLEMNFSLLKIIRYFEVKSGLKLRKLIFFLYKNENIFYLKKLYSILGWLISNNFYFFYSNLVFLKIYFNRNILEFEDILYYIYLGNLIFIFNQDLVIDLKKYYGILKMIFRIILVLGSKRSSLFLKVFFFKFFSKSKYFLFNKDFNKKEYYLYNYMKWNKKGYKFDKNFFMLNNNRLYKKKKSFFFFFSFKFWINILFGNFFKFNFFKVWIFWFFFKGYNNDLYSFVGKNYKIYLFFILKFIKVYLKILKLNLFKTSFINIFFKLYIFFIYKKKLKYFDELELIFLKLENFLFYNLKKINKRFNFIKNYYFVLWQFFFKKELVDFKNQKFFFIYLNYKFYLNLLRLFVVNKLQFSFFGKFKYLVYDNLKKISIFNFMLFFYGIRNNDITARFLARFIGEKIKKGVSIWQTLKPLRRELWLLRNLWVESIVGFKFKFVGRFNRKQRVSSIWLLGGYLPLSSISSNIDFFQYRIVLINSVCNIKVWLYRELNCLSSLYWII